MHRFAKRLAKLEAWHAKAEGECPGALQPFLIAEGSTPAEVEAMRCRRCGQHHGIEIIEEVIDVEQTGEAHAQVQ
jgi:hypothetical protein